MSLLSDIQLKANRENATHSTGPKTDEGKAAVRLNAVTHGLYARSLLVEYEDPEQYKQLCANLESEWQPQSFTERVYVEQMATALWRIARNTNTERVISEQLLSDPQRQFNLVDRLHTQRSRLERSFAQAQRSLAELQRDRRKTETKPLEPCKSKAAAPSGPQPTTHNPPPPYVMSEPTGAPPIVCADSDTR